MESFEWFLTERENERNRGRTSESRGDGSSFSKESWNEEFWSGLKTKGALFVLTSLSKWLENINL